VLVRSAMLVPLSECVGFCRPSGEEWLIASFADGADSAIVSTSLHWQTDTRSTPQRARRGRIRTWEPTG